MAERSVRLYPEAERDLEKGLRFYLGRSPVVCERFLADVDAGLALLQEALERRPLFHLGTRRFVMAAFPYSIIYRTVGDEVQVIAVAHAKRRPMYWGKRRLRQGAVAPAAAALIEICETAWTVGFVELGMAPEPEAADLLAERQAFAPRPWPLLDHADGLPSAQSTWAFGLLSGGRPVATVTARRRLGRLDFEPLRFVAVVQGLVDRFVAVPDGGPAAKSLGMTEPAAVAGTSG